MARLTHASCLLALIAALSFGVASQGWAGSSGSSGSRSGGGTYVYTTNPGYLQSAPLGPRTSLTFDLTDAAPTATEGDIALKGVIAQHQLRVAEARVLLVAAHDHNREIPAGTVLARLTTDDKSVPVLWCDLRPKTGYRRWAHDCLADPTGSGRFDEIWTGVSFNDFLGFDPGGAAGRRTLTAPVTYRPASVLERPTALLGYQWCDGDGVSGPPRFAYAVTVPGEANWSNGGKLGCNLGVWPDPANHSRVDLDGHDLTVVADPKTGQLHYRFAGRIPPTLGLQPLVAGASLRPSAPVPAPAAAAAVAEQSPVKPAPDRPLVADGTPPAVVSGPLVTGQAFFTVGVRHGVTGVLTTEAHDHGTFSEHTLPVGSPVFGIPMAGSSAAGMVWCAPHQDPPSGGQPGRWSTICMPAGDRAYMWTEAKPAMMTLDLSWTTWAGQLNGAPTVARGPISLPPMTLSYAFGGWTKKHWLTVLVQLDWGEGPQTIRTITAPPGADGSASLKVMGGAVTIRPAPQSTAPSNADPAGRAIAEIVVPPKPGAEIAY